MSDKLRKIYAAFHPSPLGPGQQDLYVNLDSIRGDSGVVRELERKIRYASQNTCQILAGHKGSGKSTELWKLREQLEHTVDGGEKFFVVNVRADEHMDRNDVDFPEVLIALVRQLATELLNREGVKLQPGYFKDRWDRLKKLLKSEVKFDKLDLSEGMGKLAVMIKDSPDSRLEVRKFLEPDTNNWLHAANDVIGEAKKELEQKGYKNLVIVMDDLDKIVTRPHESGFGTTTEYLFVHRASQLTEFDCHVVYTMPLELVYSHHEQTLEDQYAGSIPVIPMAKIATKPPKSKAYSKGLALFREIIAKRLAEAGAEHADLFKSKKIETDLIKLSGGQPTELMTLIREAIVSGDLPIESAAVKRCQQDSERTYRRMLRPDHRPIMQQVKKTGAFQRTLENESAFHELLESRAILLYRNAEEWYALHPVLEDVDFAPPRTDDAQAED